MRAATVLMETYAVLSTVLRSLGWPRLAALYLSKARSVHDCLDGADRVPARSLRREGEGERAQAALGLGLGRGSLAHGWVV